MRSRHSGIDWLKFICAQLIVLHHATTYAPHDLHLSLLWPHLSGLLLEPGRWVVHVFLVIGGYLSLQGLLRTQHMSWPSLAWQRYGRLMPLFLLALLMTLFMSWWVRDHYAPEFISNSPTWLDALAHLTLTFDWWGVPAISAGAWYVAIDFQLYVLLAFLVLAFRRSGLPTMDRGLAILLALTLVMATLTFSRQASLDAYAPYFWGSYGLGCLVAMVQHQNVGRRWLWLALACLAVDLSIDWRDRQGLALATGAFLLVWPNIRQRLTTPAWLAWANEHSYALFVGHFSFLIALGAWWTAHGPSGSIAALAYLVTAGLLAWLWAWALQTLLNGPWVWLTRYLPARARWA